MKTIVASMVFAVVCVCTAVSAGEKKKEEAKSETEKSGETDKKKDYTPMKVGDTVWNLEYLDKTWGIKVKSIKVEGNERKLLMEFGKDVETDLNEMRKAFYQQSAGFKFYLFDEDNVVIGTAINISVNLDELTGKKGDAFRLSMVIPRVPRGELVRKVEARPNEKAKK